MLVEVKQTAKTIRISQGFLVLIAYGKGRRLELLLSCVKKVNFTQKDIILDPKI